MSKDKAGKTDGVRVVLGNTERPAAEIISHIRRNAAEFAGFSIKPADSAEPRIGQAVIEVRSPDGDIDAEKLRQVLNETGACMFQVDSVTKLSQ